MPSLSGLIFYLYSIIEKKMRKIILLALIFTGLGFSGFAQNGNAATITRDIKQEAEKLKNGTEAVKQGKKKAAGMSKAQKDALKKKKKSVNAKNAKKELDKMLK